MSINTGSKVKLLVTTALEKTWGEKQDILFIDILDSDISSSIIRKKILSNNSKEFLSMDNMLDKDVFNYIQNKNKICQH